MIPEYYTCPVCGKQFKACYINKVKFNIFKDLGSSQRYNYRAPMANFKKHVSACKKKGDGI